MVGNPKRYQCSRCGTEFPVTETHTEIVRRDFVDIPRPTRIERLCVDCWDAYIAEFLGEDFDDLLEEYERR